MRRSSPASQLLMAWTLGCSFGVALPAAAQTISQLTGNGYANQQELDPSSVPPNCRAYVSFNRQMRIGALRGDRVIGRISIRRSGSTNFTGGAGRWMRNGATGQTFWLPPNKEDQEDCQALGLPLRTEIEVEFLPTQGRFSSVVVSTNERDLEGERNEGNFSVLEGGRAILMEYSDVRRVYRLVGPLAVAALKAPEAEPGQSVGTPNRVPDLVMACQPISVRERTVTSNSTHSYSGSGSSQGGGSSVSEQCRDSNWQARRLSIPIWTQERVCGNVRCAISAQSYAWPGVDINRYSGQLTDACFVWQCTRTQGAPVL